MKQLRSVFTLLAITVCLLISAQDYKPEIILEGTLREAMVVDYFTTSYGINRRDYHYVEDMQQAALKAVKTSNRFFARYADDNGDLRALDASRTSTGDYMRKRYEIMRNNLEARFALECNITQIDVEPIKNSKNWKGLVAYSLTIVNTENGNVVCRMNVNPTDTYTSNSNPEDAIKEACNKIYNKVRIMLLDRFRTQGQILQVESNNKKGEPQLVYINMGTNNGAAKGDKFEIFKIKSVMGKQAETKVGELKVENVQGDEISIAKITKGQKDIKVLIDANQPLKIVSCGPGFWDDI